MYDTLGYRLEIIAKNNLKKPKNNILLKNSSNNNLIYRVLLKEVYKKSRNQTAFKRLLTPLKIKFSGR